MSVTLMIVLITCLVSFIAFSNQKLTDDLLFWPYKLDTRREYYRFLTGGFIHADSMHLLFNMFSLYSFGEALEIYLFPQLFGDQAKLFYAILYLGGIVFSSIPDFFLHRNHPSYRALGASGAVSAVIFSAIMILPNMPIRFFFIPVDIPGYLFGFIFLGLSYYLAKKGQGNIGHNAHFWGAVFGLVFTVTVAWFYARINLPANFLDKVF